MQIKNAHLNRYMMSYKGFSAEIMEAPRLVGDHTFGLPPGTALPVFESLIFNEYPSNWMRGPGVFVVPVRPNKGLWFNWRMNDENNQAVIPVVKGCNPITGLMCSGFHLERYENKCPKHGCDFQLDRFCPECGYKWPAQNYVCQSPAWWDGWRDSGDGSVRQFFFTEDEVRDIATHMIGKENTVPAFGFAFYRPKVERPNHQVRSLYLCSNSEKFDFGTGNVVKSCYGTNDVNITGTSVYFTGGGCKGMSVGHTTNGLIGAGPEVSNTCYGQSDQMPIACAAGGYEAFGEHPVPKTKAKKAPQSIRMAKVEHYEPKQEVAIGAGAKINQELVPDPYPLDTWKDAPDSVMTIYFVFKEEVDRMLSKGVVEITEKTDGMLEGLPVG